MSKVNDFYNPADTTSPLDYAMKKRSEPIIETVIRAIEPKRVLLAYQPIVHAKSPIKPAFYEKSICRGIVPLL